MILSRLSFHWARKLKRFPITDRTPVPSRVHSYEIYVRIVAKWHYSPRPRAFWVWRECNSLVASLPVSSIPRRLKRGTDVSFASWKLILRDCRRPAPLIGIELNEVISEIMNNTDNMNIIHSRILLELLFIIYYVAQHSLSRIIYSLLLLFIVTRNAKTNSRESENLRIPNEIPR